MSTFILVRKQLKFSTWIACSLFLAVGASLSAQTNSNPNRFRIGYSMGFNISTRVQDRGGSQLHHRRSLSGLVYEDGFVSQDSSGNEGGLTWNWGYDHNNQIVSDHLLLSRSRVGDLQKEFDGSPEHGLELTYARELGQLSHLTWGLETAFGYTDLNSSESAMARRTARVLDTFALDGVIPPLAPYSGSFSGPGPLIGTDPTRASVQVLSTFEGAAYAFRLGPYLEWPLARRLGVALSAGLSTMVVDGEARIRERLSMPGLGTRLSTAVASDTDFLVGGYISGTFSVGLTDSLSLFTGCRYENAGDFILRSKNKKTTVDFGNAVSVTIGIGCSF